jgi:adenylate cyclase class 2
MPEIELKITHLPKEEILKRLRAIGAKQNFPETLLTDIFYAQRKDARGNSQTIRLRHTKNSTTLTAKRKKTGGRFKVMDESEMAVESLETAQKLLHMLGFRITSRREKLREEYRFEDVTIEIDTYPGMKPYMEIEAKNKLSLLRFLHAFGLSITQTSNLSAKEIILKAKKNPDLITFSAHEQQLPHRAQQTKNSGPRNYQRSRTNYQAPHSFSGKPHRKNPNPKAGMDRQAS